MANWRYGLAVARANRAREKSKEPRKVPKRKGIKKITPSKFKRALPGTGGILHLLAYKLNCKLYTVRNIIYMRKEMPRWVDAIAAYHAECERVVDLAEGNVFDTQKRPRRYSEDVVQANARWILERKGKHRGYGREVTIQGGDKPLQVQGDIKLDMLKLPLDIRLGILRAMEAQQNDDVIDITTTPALPAPHVNGDNTQANRTKEKP